MEPGYRLIDHTADAGIEAWGADLPAVFDRCAAGLFGLIIEGEPVRPAVSAPLRASAFDLPELLVAWLRELLWWHHQQEWLYAAATWERLEGTSLAALVRGERCDPARHALVREVKAVTYHDLAVEPRGEGWYARVIFDL